MKHDSFDRSLRYASHRINGVYFEPWKGKDYGANSRWGKSVLVVGESHYEWCAQRWDHGNLLPRDTSTFVIDERAVEKKRDGFSTKIAISFLGKTPHRDPPQGEMFYFWHSVCFYNFVQEGVGYRNRERPTRGELQKALNSSVEGYGTVMADLNPEVVVIYSRLVWAVLQPNNPARTEGVSEYTEDGRLMLGLPHPSSRQFGNARQYNPSILAALKSVRQV
jgi:hypothetical protein